jgi:hypothetical protein
MSSWTTESDDTESVGSEEEFNILEITSFLENLRNRTNTMEWVQSINNLINHFTRMYFHFI